MCLGQSFKCFILPYRQVFYKSFKCQFIIQEVHEIYIVKDGAEFPCTKDGDIEVGGLVINVFFTGIPTPH